MTKHTLVHIVSIFLLLNMVCFLSSCNEEEIESFEVETPASTHMCRMTFDVDFTGFDAQDGTTRASIHGWDDGDVVYLSFTTSGNGTVGGNAIYDATNNDWTVTYTGSLSSTEQGSVKVYYYDGEVTKSSNTLTIDPTVGVYADLKGSYKYSRENGVNVSASLSPQTSRIRFKGDTGKTITVSGIKSFTEYNQQSGVLTTTPISSSVTVSSDGFTPYIYGVFEDSSKPSISINSEGCRFTKDCSSSVFQIGESGWMNVPSRAAHDNWKMEDLSEAHVVLTDTDQDGVGETLIFYYDDVDHSQEGMVFKLNTESNDPEWLVYNEKITNVIFDPGFVYAKPTSTYNWFHNCSNLTSISGIKYLDTSEVTNMCRMFSGCFRLTNLDLSSFKTDAVYDIQMMFENCIRLTSIDLRSFDTAGVVYMDYMFAGCSSLTSLDLSNFNTAGVVFMEYMFYGCSSLTSLDLGNFNTAAVISMNYMFRGCSSLTSLDLSNFNTAGVVFMDYMFCGCSSLTSLDLSSFNTAAVRSMGGMFYNCSSLTNLNLSSFDTEAVTDMHEMFFFCNSLTSLDISSFNTAAVVDMSNMFYSCLSLSSIDISNFDISDETEIVNFLKSCNNLTSINVGSNDLSANITSNTIFDGIGSSTTPCNLIIDSGFDKSVLGDYNGRYYRWRGGYFAEPTMEQSDLNYEYVDLGLPSGTLWATTDLGSNNIHIFGNLYAWGETSSKNEFSNNNYTYTGESPLPLSSDAAYVNMGVNWRMPTKIEWKELVDNCTWDYYFYNNYDACLVGTSNINGKTITFCLKDYHADEESDSDYYSCYWSRDEFSSLLARAFNVHLYDSSGWYYCSVFETRDYKYNGLLIRAVRNN